MPGSPDRNTTCFDRIVEPLEAEFRDPLVLETVADETFGAGRDDDAIRPGEDLEPRGQVGSLAGDVALGLVASTYDVGDHHKPGGDADADLRRGTAERGELADCLDRRQGGKDRSFRVILIGARVAEINQSAIAHVVGDKAAKPGNRLGDRAVVRTDELTKFFRIELGRQRGRSNQIVKQDCQLPAFGERRPRRFSRRRR